MSEAQMLGSDTDQDAAGRLRGDRPVALHPLRYLDEGAEVTVGRPDTDEYAVLPAEGAALLRQLSDGSTPDEAAGWYEGTYGEPVDIADFLATLDELGFLRAAGEAAPAAAPVRWTRLGRAVFSPAGAACYLLLLAAGAVAALRSPALVPGYHRLFFTHYMTVLELVTFGGQIPLVLLHELAHALAGRRLGLRTRLSVGRRLYYPVFITAMDGLVSVPRAKRYLPMLAGMLTDLGVIAALILVADLTRRPGGAVSAAGAVALAFAYLTVLRFAWQFWFYLQTDLYYVVVTVFGCVDLQGTARKIMRARLRRALRRPAIPDRGPGARPQDLAVARWYSWLLPLGYATSITLLVVAVVPTAARIGSTVFARLAGSGAQGRAGVADSVTFILLNVIQIVVLLVVVRRERRSRPARRGPDPVAGGST